MGWLTERVTHHGRAGKFCAPHAATTVTKNGERFKVVRQHRRIKMKGQAELESIKDKATVAVARGTLRGWTPVKDLIEGAPSYKIQGVSKDGVTLNVTFAAKPLKFPVIDYKGSKWMALAGTLAADGKYFADYRKEGSLALGSMGRL